MVPPEGEHSQGKTRGADSSFAAVVRTGGTEPTRGDSVPEPESAISPWAGCESANSGKLSSWLFYHIALLNKLMQITIFLMNSVNSAKANITKTRHEGWEQAVYVNSTGGAGSWARWAARGGQLACEALGSGVDRYRVLVPPLDDYDS